MRTRKDDGLNMFSEAGSCNISSLIGDLLKKFSAIDSVCMNLLQSLVPEVLGQSGFDKVTSGSNSDEKRKAKARERQAAIMAKMKAEQSKFLSTLSSSMEDDETETETSATAMDHDSEIAIREICSLCHDPDSKDPVSFLIFLQKSKLVSFVDRGPPCWDQGPQSETKISDGAPDLLRMSDASDNLGITGAHVLQLSDDTSFQATTDSVLESLRSRFMGNSQAEKRSNDGKGKDESNMESMEIAMYQTVRKKFESPTGVEEHQAESSSKKRNFVSGYNLRSSSSKRNSVDFGSDRFHPTDCDGVNLLSCGHAVHQSYLDRYINSLKERSVRRNVFEGAHIVNLDQGEFLCPACRLLANSVLPACPEDLNSVSKLQESRKDSQQGKYSFCLSEALCLIRSTAEAVEDCSKNVKTAGVEQRRKDLDLFGISSVTW